MSNTVPNEVWLRVIDKALNNTLNDPSNFGAHDTEHKLRLIAKNLEIELGRGGDMIAILHRKEQILFAEPSNKSTVAFLQHIRGFMQTEGYEIPPAPLEKIDERGR